MFTSGYCRNGLFPVLALQAARVVLHTVGTRVASLQWRLCYDIAKLYEIIFCWKKDLQSNGLPHWLLRISGNLEASMRRVWFPPSVPADSTGTWGPAFAGLPGIPPGLGTWGAASMQEGSQAWGSGALLGHPRRCGEVAGFSMLCFPWSEESQFYLKAPNRAPFSRNLLLVGKPPKR